MLAARGVADAAREAAAHLTAPPPRPSIARPDVPEPLDQVIAIGMAKDPDQRCTTTIELAAAAHDAITVPIQQPTPPLVPYTLAMDPISHSPPWKVLR
jgi:hypothetical protein